MTAGNVNPNWGFGAICKRNIHEYAKVKQKYNRQTSTKNAWTPLNKNGWNADSLEFKDMEPSRKTGGIMMNFIDSNGDLHLSNACKGMDMGLHAYVGVTTFKKANGRKTRKYNFLGVFKHISQIPDQNNKGRYENIYRMVSKDLIGF